MGWKSARLEMMEGDTQTFTFEGFESRTSKKTNKDYQVLLLDGIFGSVELPQFVCSLRGLKDQDLVKGKRIEIHFERDTFFIRPL